MDASTAGESVERFVQETISTLHTGLRQSSSEDRQKHLFDLLALLQELKAAQHPAAGALAAAVGAEILPLLEETHTDGPVYEFEKEEHWFAQLAADTIRTHIRWLRGAAEAGSNCANGEAFELWHPPCFVRREFAFDLQDVFELILKDQGRGRYCETHFFKPLSEVLEDDDAKSAFRKEIETTFFQQLTEMIGRVRGNDTSLQYQCRELLKRDSLEHGYYFYNDLDLSFVESLLSVRQDTIEDIRDAIHVAWDRDLPPEEMVGVLDEMGGQANTFLLDCVILSTFYERDGVDLDIRSLHRTLIGTNRSLEVAAGLRPILFGELMRIPSNLAENLANPKPTDNPTQQSRRFDILVRFLSALGASRLPGLEDKIVALAWGKPHLSGLVSWINDGCPEHARPFLKQPANCEATQLVN